MLAVTTFSSRRSYSASKIFSCGSLKLGISLDAAKKEIVGMGYVRPSLVYLRSLSAVRSELSTPSLHLKISSSSTMSASGILPEVCTTGSLRCSKATAFRYVSSLSAALPSMVKVSGAFFLCPKPSTAHFRSKRRFWYISSFSSAESGMLPGIKLDRSTRPKSCSSSLCLESRRSNCRAPVMC